MLTIVSSIVGYSTYQDYVASGSDPTNFWINQSTGFFVPYDKVSDDTDKDLTQKLVMGWLRIRGNCVDHHGELTEKLRSLVDSYHVAHPEIKELVFYDVATGQYINKALPVSPETLVPQTPAPTIIHEVEQDEVEPDWPILDLPTKVAHF